MSTQDVCSINLVQPRSSDDIDDVSDGLGVGNWTRRSYQRSDGQAIQNVFSIGEVYLESRDALSDYCFLELVNIGNIRANDEDEGETSGWGWLVDSD